MSTHSLSSLSLDLFLLGHVHMAAGQAGQGYGFERRVRAHLDELGLPIGSGFRVLGRRSLSGLYHQLDAQTDCGDALVIGEWKAYRGAIPKNDLLRFKAATDDYWMAGGAGERQPVMRLFGGTGCVSDGMRTYAAHAGIILITPDRWPIPALCEPSPVLEVAGFETPTATDRRCMLSLVKSMRQAMQPQADGSWRVPPAAPAADLARRLQLWHRASERTWDWCDDSAPSRFEALMAARCDLDQAA